jgi:peptidoglycan/LPS O-acetylase OafA/YrhL
MTQAAASSSAQPSATIEATTTSIERIPTLDGWRGIAIALVLFDHIQYAIFGNYIVPWSQTGQHGVTIFFVLSGFLITSKLIEGPIHLKRFYIRRFFRLMPVAWLYLLVLVLIGLKDRTRVTSPQAILSSLFFYRNFVSVEFGESTWHFWSLSLEEQFYLVWPCLLLLVGIRRCRWIAVAGALGCAMYRFEHWAHYDRISFSSQSQVRADALLVGSLTALLLNEAHIRTRATIWAKWWVVPAFVGLIYYTGHFIWLPPLGEDICIAALITASILHPHSWTAKPLSFRALTQMGLVSYSLYVWQGLFMLLDNGLNLNSAFLLFIGMPLVALGSFEYVEQPLNRLGHRLAS